MRASSFRLLSNASLVLAGGLLTLVLTSCGSEEAPEAGAPTPPPAEGQTSGTFEGKSKSGDSYRASFGDEAALPEDFPDDIPMLADGKIIASVSVGPGKVLSLHSDLPLEEIYGFYEQSLADQGWSFGAETETTGARTLNASKTGRVLQLFVVEAQGSRRLSLTLMDEG